MKKFILISILMGALPFSMAAQDDDLYFASKKKTEKKVTYNDGAQTDVYHSGSNRSVDEYNRMESGYEVIGNDSINDIITFSAEKGVYPDSLMMVGSDSLIIEDYALTKKMMRFDDYDLTNNAAFWAGYQAGVDTWSWHSPWYYRTYGWYGAWYDPWYPGSVWSWYDPFYWDYPYWNHLTWYGPYYGYGYYAPYGYYSYYPYGYYPYYSYYNYYPYYYAYGGGGRYHNTYNGNTGTIDRRGSTHGTFSGDRSVARSSSGLSSSRSSTLRDRTVGDHRSRISNSSANNSSTRSNNTSNSGNFSGRRTTTNTSTYNNSRSTTTYSNSSSSMSSGGGSFSSGGGGGFSGGGGGGGRSGGGGGSLGGRR
jgi:hypothetical protein